MRSCGKAAVSGLPLLRSLIDEIQFTTLPAINGTVDIGRCAGVQEGVAAARLFENRRLARLHFGPLQQEDQR
jgi:hypothetical protein